MQKFTQSHIFTAGEAEIMLAASQRSKDHFGNLFFHGVLASLSKGSPYTPQSRLKASGGQYLKSR
jgi:hypothetical protein